MTPDASLLTPCAEPAFARNATPAEILRVTDQNARRFAVCKARHDGIIQFFERVDP